MRVELDIHPLAPGEIEPVAAVLGLARLRQGDGMYLVAWHDGQPLGHAHLALTDPPELQDLEVRPDRMRANMSDDVYAERDAFAERGLADRSGDWLGSAGTFVDRALARWRKSA